MKAAITAFDAEAAPPEDSPARDGHDAGYDLGAARRVAEVRSEQLAEAHQEIERLRETAAEVASLRAQVASLKDEVARLSAAGYIARSTHEKASFNQEVPCGPGPLVERLAAAEEVRSAVITNEMGFVVASHGELSEVLGAFGTFLAGAAARATMNLPVGEVREVRLRGENDLTIGVYRTPQNEGEELTLTVVELLPERPEDRVIKDRLRRAATLLRP